MRARAFYHFTLGGDLTVEEREILHRAVEKVVCRWCGSADSVAESEGTAPEKP